jgi:hypothetical protein
VRQEPAVRAAMAAVIGHGLGQRIGSTAQASRSEVWMATRAG